jgi:hypothetical protein
VIAVAEGTVRSDLSRHSSEDLASVSIPLSVARPRRSDIAFGLRVRGCASLCDILLEVG